MKVIAKEPGTHHIVLALVKLFDASLDEDANEKCFNIPGTHGSGYCRSVEFDHGVSVFEAELSLAKNLSLTFETETLNPLKILFNLDEPVIHYFVNSDEAVKINRLNAIMASCDISDQHLIKFNKKKPTTIFMIDIDRKAFESKVELFLNDMDTSLESLLRDVNGVNKFCHDSYFTLEISEMIEAFKNCEHSDFMRSTFLEGKVYEILTYFLQHYVNTINNADQKTLLRKTTIKKIEAAVDIIKEELDSRISVNSLAKRVGINQNTLQSGFKTLFNTSVNEYIRNYKLDQSKILIEKSDLNITEITYRIGINSRSYFSKLFKERYGISPTQYASQLRNKAS